MSPLEVKRDGKGNIFSWVRKKWLVETPEETVRQQFLPVLVDEYGFQIDQISEELEVTGRGSGHARADFVIWRTAQDKIDKNSPLIVVECKSDNVTIKADDYWQGDNYGRLSGAQFLITHNTRETKFWRVVHGKMPKSLEEIENVPHANASDDEIRELLERLKVFKEHEFADLLHECHNIIRNREHLDPAAAFDEIAKILFIKVWVERELQKKKKRKNLFSAEFLDEQIGSNPIQTLFDQTKAAYEGDHIFAADAKMQLKPATSREIVKKLQRYNLSATSEDIKGIAFERFLGRTFRGEIGQFFTPRTVVEFMVRFVDPQEGEVVCDPASGSGGFLIRFFEIVRELIHADIDREYKEFQVQIESQGLSEETAAETLRKKYEELQKQLDPTRNRSRIWKLSNETIFGTDANDRMARTSKMNMIMHGDGHGGVHHRNGFLNVNGIFEERFDIILTNPPFGSKVEPTDLVEKDMVHVPREERERYEKRFGRGYKTALARITAGVNEPIAALFNLPKNPSNAIKTELLFVERCLDLLRPGGRLGIVLPEGVFNNPSLAYVREFVEERARLDAVVSLPEGTFKSAKASVKCSLLFLHKYTEEELADVQRRKGEALESANTSLAEQTAEKREQLVATYEGSRGKAKTNAKRVLVKFEKEHAARVEDVAKSRFRASLDYPVFMYDAQHVGITATGDPDFNELYPNDALPPGVERSCLELYREFLDDPSLFMLEHR